MLEVVSQEISHDQHNLALSITARYPVGDDEAVGLEYFAKVTSSDGGCLVTPVETALLTKDDNETSIWKSFQCPTSFKANKIYIFYKAYFSEDGGLVDLGMPDTNSISLKSHVEGGSWEAGSISTVVINEDGGSADLTITLECSQAFDWGWMITPVSGDSRGYPVFGLFKGTPAITVETNTYEMDEGVQLDIAFLRAGPQNEISIEV